MERLELLELLELAARLNRSSRSSRSKRSRRLGQSREMSFFDQRQRDTASAEQFVVKLTQNEFIAQPCSFSIPQPIDDRPT